MVEVKPLDALVYNQKKVDIKDVIAPPYDVITNEEQQKSKDDLLQFSLFGNDEVVSSKQEKDSYTMKE